MTCPNCGAEMYREDDEILKDPDARGRRPTVHVSRYLCEDCALEAEFRKFGSSEWFRVTFDPRTQEEQEERTYTPLGWA